ncbi:Hypothetical protein HVR_LOCUS896 [uncultured virus]|nr:Hypothetical protein HVR_LOCUS896 [uncultured virus]
MWILNMSILISGAVNVIVIAYNNVKFILFSDSHGSFEGVCPNSCLNVNDVNSGNSTTEESLICYTVDGVIGKIIQEANKNGEYVDIYLEGPIRDKLLEYPASRDDLRDVSANGPLFNTIYEFYSCLYDNKNCSYVNARFHYIDYRTMLMGIKLSPLKWIVQYLEHCINSDNLNKLGARNDNISVHLSFFVVGFIIGIFLNNNKLEETNLWVYIRLSIESDDFMNDFKTSFNKLLIMPHDYIESTINLLIHRYRGSKKYTPEKIRKYVNSAAVNVTETLYAKFLHPMLIITKHGRIMHLLRAQLLGLELQACDPTKLDRSRHLRCQGDFSRAQSIKEFIMKKISSVDLAPLIDNFHMYNQERISYLNTGNLDMELLASIEKNVPQWLIPVIIVDATLVDLYTLSRMFRIYPTEFRTHNKLPTPHIPASYIIEYAGFFHINNVSEYLTSTGGTIEIYNPLPEYKRCVEAHSVL